MKAISIKQPWAYLIAAGVKNIENRTWKCPKKYIGTRVLIHASAKSCKDIYNIFSEDQKNIIFNNTKKSAIENIRTGVDVHNSCKITSSIIGSVEIVDCVINNSSIWAEKSIDCKDGCPDVENCPVGKCPHLVYNWVLANTILFDNPILNVKGKLGFWDYEFSEDDYECTNDNGYTLGSCGEKVGCIQDCGRCDYYKCKYEI